MAQNTQHVDEVIMDSVAQLMEEGQEVNDIIDSLLMSASELVALNECHRCAYSKCSSFTELVGNAMRGDGYEEPEGQDRHSH